MKFTFKKLVSPCDLDMNYIASPSAYLRYMQEVAHLHMTAYPPSPEQLRDQYHKVFIISKMTMSVYRDLHACEEITVSTWASPPHGISCPRNVEIKVGDETAAAIASVWALVDTETHSLCRPDEYPCSYSTEPPIETELSLRFRIPRDLELEYVGEYTPHYSDIDLNHHVNNTRYPDIFCGFLPDMNGKRVKNLGISYLREAHVGESLKIYSASTESGTYFRSIRPDGEINAEVLIVTEDIIR